MGVVSRKPRWRAARWHELKRRGVTPSNRQRVWLVQPTALLAIPDYFTQRAVRGLWSWPGSVWLRPGAAKLLCGVDRAAGGWCHVTQSEFKRCTLCARPLRGAEAATRREVLESDPNAKLLPCGPNCEKDRELKIWVSEAPN